MQITLASASPTRARLLRQVGIDHQIMPARVDEDAVLRAAMSGPDPLRPRDLADLLAEAKARKVAGRGAPDLVLGSDQILALAGEVIAPPADRNAAADQLHRLQGATHNLYSAAVIYEDNSPVWRAVGEARMTMHSLSASQIEAYLDHAWTEVAGSVGAYHAEGFGAQLFSRIDGDWYSVLGLPLLQVMSFLRLRGSPS
ncbi:MAG: Maf family protein [Rhodobacteraceae bacterium]|nr:Maf family protein [Paracoccaceae bacterium]